MFDRARALTTSLASIWHPWRSSIYGLLSALTFFVAAWANNALTQTMWLHMLVHIPLIIVAGVLACQALSVGRLTRYGWARAIYAAYAYLNQHGIPGLLFVSFAGGYWMVPKALDDVLISQPMQLMKFGVLFLAGMVLLESWRRAHLVIKLFFLGNFCWMTAIVGLLYQEEPARLCNFYLQSDQEIAGIGLVIMAAVLPSVWLLSEIRAVLRYLKQ